MQAGYFPLYNASYVSSLNLVVIRDHSTVYGVHKVVVHSQQLWDHRRLPSLAQQFWRSSIYETQSVADSICSEAGHVADAMVKGVLPTDILVAQKVDRVA